MAHIKNLDDKKKKQLIYYEEVIDPNLKDQKYLYVITSLKLKSNLLKNKLSWTP